MQTQPADQGCVKSGELLRLAAAHPGCIRHGGPEAIAKIGLVRNIGDGIID